MGNDTTALVKQAEEHVANRKFHEAGACFEQAAAETADRREAAELFKKAAGAFREYLETEDAVRCYRRAGDLLEKDEKVWCLLEGWKTYISGIAGDEYDCGFEWRGATDGSHHGDHEMYESEIDRFMSKAEELLREALAVPGADRNEILKKAKQEWRRRKEGDKWGADRCEWIIRQVEQDLPKE